MKVLVTVKRVIDYNVQIRVKADGSGVETENMCLPISRIRLGRLLYLESGIVNRLGFVA